MSGAPPEGRCLHLELSQGQQLNLDSDSGRATQQPLPSQLLQNYKTTDGHVWKDE
jgi:hypothetical protein